MPSLLTMSNSIQHDNALTPMFELCRQVSPYLNGKLQTGSDHTSEQNWIEGSTNDVTVIQRLYYALQKTSPDAGSAYWMTRSWDLLCWQPIYIAFIAIYGLKQLPDFSQFKQRFQHNAIFGFAFQSDTIYHATISSTATSPLDTVEILIAQAGAQLKPLLAYYREQLDAVIRCRPGYVKRLLTDLILDSLLKVRDIIPDFSDQDVQHHAQLWLHAFDIPTNIQHSLIVNEKRPISHIRTSCCLTDKAGNELCANCPKKHKSKTKLKPKPHS